MLGTLATGGSLVTNATMLLTAEINRRLCPQCEQLVPSEHSTRWHTVVMQVGCRSQMVEVRWPEALSLWTEPSLLNAVTIT